MKMRRFGTILLAVALVSVALPVAAQRQTGRLFRVTVESNVPNATLFLNGEAQKPGMPVDVTIAPGRYTFVVQAPGYVEFSRTVTIDRSQTIVANLTPLNRTLSVTSNVLAQVFVNGAAVGATPFVGQYPPGVYALTVRAPGYEEYSAQIDLSEDRAVGVALMPLPATVRFELPPEYRSNRANVTPLRLFVDGQEIASPFQPFTVTPGRHTIRLESATIQVEVPFDFAAATTYVLAPTFGLSLR